MNIIFYEVFVLVILVLFIQAIDDNRRNPPLGMNGGL